MNDVQSKRRDFAVIVGIENYKNAVLAGYELKLEDFTEVKKLKRELEKLKTSKHPEVVGKKYVMNEETLQKLRGELKQRVDQMKKGHQKEITKLTQANIRLKEDFKIETSKFEEQRTQMNGETKQLKAELEKLKLVEKTRQVGCGEQLQILNRQMVSLQQEKAGKERELNKQLEECGNTLRLERTSAKNHENKQIKQIGELEKIIKEITGTVRELKEANENLEKEMRLQDQRQNGKTKQLIANEKARQFFIKSYSTSEDAWKYYDKKNKKSGFKENFVTKINIWFNEIKTSKLYEMHQSDVKAACDKQLRELDRQMGSLKQEKERKQENFNKQLKKCESTLEQERTSANERNRDLRKAATELKEVNENLGEKMRTALGKKEEETQKQKAELEKLQMALREQSEKRQRDEQPTSNKEIKDDQKRELDNLHTKIWDLQEKIHSGQQWQRKLEKEKRKNRELISEIESLRKNLLLLGRAHEQLSEKEKMKKVYKKSYANANEVQAAYTNPLSKTDPNPNSSFATFFY